MTPKNHSIHERKVVMSNCSIDERKVGMMMTIHLNRYYLAQKTIDINYDSRLYAAKV